MVPTLSSSAMSSAISGATRLLARSLPKPQVRQQAFSSSAQRPIAPQCIHNSRPGAKPRWNANHSSQSRRHASFWQNTKTLFKAHPFSLTTAGVFLLFGTGALAYTNYFYYSYIIGAFHNYPEPLAKELRKALFYTNIQPNLKDALKYYKRSLRVSQEIGMDQFSDEVLGIKIHLVGLLEKQNQFQAAIQVLEMLRADCLRWLEEIGQKEGREGQRTSVLKKTVGIAAKLGELYSCEYIQDKENAEERLVWAVETALKEKQRRDTEGTKEEEGEWLSAEELGGAIEALGDHYEQKSQHYLAAPLYLQAIALSPPQSCHTAVLMNNLSISLAQQLQPPQPGVPAVSRPELVSNARAWAQQSLNICSKIKSPDRSNECDVACAVATHNLGEFAEMDGNIAEARRRYEEAKSLAKATAFDDGVKMSEEGLKRIQGK